MALFISKMLEIKKDYIDRHGMLQFLFKPLPRLWNITKHGHDTGREQVMFYISSVIFVFNLVISYVPSFLFWGKLYCSDELKLK